MIGDVTRLASELRDQIAHDAVLGHSAGGHLNHVHIESSFLLKVASYLNERKKCTVLFDLIGTHIQDSSDDPQGMIQLLYRIGSAEPYEEVCLKVEIQMQDPSAQSLCKIWESAKWLEREVSELLGVRFNGNEHAKNFLLPDGWAGHPLRRDYVYPDSFDGTERQKQPLRKSHSRT